MHHHAGLIDFASHPCLIRPLDRPDSRELSRLCRMQIDHGKGSADLGPQNAHPSGQHHQIRFTACEEFDEAPIGCVSHIGIAARVFDHMAGNIGRFGSLDHASSWPVGDHRHDACVQVAVITSIDQSLTIRAPTRGQHDDTTGLILCCTGLILCCTGLGHNARTNSRVCHDVPLNIHKLDTSRRTVVGHGLTNNPGRFID